MTNIDFEAKHPRQDSGKFAAKEGSEPSIELEFGERMDPVECIDHGFHLRNTDNDGYCNVCGHQEPGFEPGTRVLQQFINEDGEDVTLQGSIIRMYDNVVEGGLSAEVQYADGNWDSAVDPFELEEDVDVDSTEGIARAKRVAAGMSLVDAELSDSQRAHLMDIHYGINEGAWGDIRGEANDALQHLRGLIEEDSFEEMDYQRMDDAFETKHRQIVRNGGSDDEIAVNAIARATANAVFFHDRIGEHPKWTQEAYDHLTRPYREAVGAVHEDDIPTPASWADRQHTAMSAERKFEGYPAPALRALTETLYDEYQEAASFDNTERDDADVARAKRAWEQAQAALNSRYRG